jgi:hypothetical protein
MDASWNTGFPKPSLTSKRASRSLAFLRSSSTLNFDNCSTSISIPFTADNMEDGVRMLFIFREVEAGMGRDANGHSWGIIGD